MRFCSSFHSVMRSSDQRKMKYAGYWCHLQVLTLENKEKL
jgi:hypothetical protein